jgi:hypothetical protein
MQLIVTFDSFRATADSQGMHSVFPSRAAPRFHTQRAAFALGGDLAAPRAFT